MIDLDDPSFVKSTPNGEAVLKSIDAYPKQLEQAWIEASQIEFPSDYKKVKNIVVCGMGGSRFTPLTVKELFKAEIKLPYLTNDNYELPGFVGPETLVILSSYSGTTEEVIQCAETARAKHSKITGLCLGGPLADFYRQHNLPAYIFVATYNPSGQPRIGVGYMVAGHIGLLYAAGLLDVKKSDIEEAIKHVPELLKSYSLNISQKHNPAKQMAKKLFHKYPYYITAEHLQGVGNAIANQTNETAKSISSYRYIPELNHHLMEGLKFPHELKKLGIFVLFPSHLYDKRVQTRFKITEEVVEKNGLETLTRELKGKTKVEQVLELIGFGSYMTMYLSALYEQDPSVIPWVDYFKLRLKELS